MMFKHCFFGLTRFKLARAQPDLQVSPVEVHLLVSTGLEALSDAPQGFNPSRSGLLANEFEIIASVLSMCSTPGTEPKRETNVGGHLVCLMHSNLPKGKEHAFLFTISTCFMLKVFKLNLINTRVMPYCQANTSTRKCCFDVWQGFVKRDF